jgi:hypothetical protein
VAAICDEIAFWHSEDSANPDHEILAALRPAMTTVRGAVLLCISSPYSRRGALWTAYKEHFGKDGDPILVWQASTRDMNPVVDETIIRDAYEADEAAAEAEYGAQFRRDIEAFVSEEAVARVVVPGRRELPPVDGVRYFGFVDFSGGSQDSMTVAVAHREGSRTVLDAVREVKPPFSPEDVTRDFCALLKAYRIHVVTGDRYGGLWPRDRFKEHGIGYEVSDDTKTELYKALLPQITSGTVELLDQSRLVRQLVALERTVSRSGADLISHPPGQHDDVVNSAAGALAIAGKRRTQMLQGYTWAPPDKPTPEQQQGSVRVEIVTHYYARCRNGHQYAVPTKEQAEREHLCAQEGWSMGPWGIGYYSGRRTLEVS